MVKRFQTRRSIVLTIAAATCIWLPYLFRKDNLSNFYSSSPHPTEFVAYIPSNFEEEWFAKREEYQKKPESACDDFKQRSEDIALWLSPQNSLAKEENVGALVRPERVMSKFLFRQTNKMYIRRIEPLVGQFRHPYALQACKPSRAKPVGIQDRSYISFVGLHDQYDLNSLFPGKKHLFDLGTAEFPTSLGFLVPKFASHGIVFDHIWAWEAKNMTHYWDLVPPELERKMHFYHHPVSSEVQSPAHPLQIIKAEVKPGDYVVVKLDIDKAELEMQIMNYILNDEILLSMISEMMFEMHYDSPYMRAYFGSPSTSYSDVLETFREFRKRGLFLHYWP